MATLTRMTQLHGGFSNVSDHSGTLCIKGLTLLLQKSNYTKKHTHIKTFHNHLKRKFIMLLISLTLLWQKSLPYRNQSTDFLCKSMDWFLCDRHLCHERVTLKIYFLLNRRVFLVLFVLLWYNKILFLRYWSLNEIKILKQPPIFGNVA